MNNIEMLVSELGNDVTFPNAQRNYCTYDEQKTAELVNAREEAWPYIDTFLKSATTEEQVLDSLQVLDKMLDKGVKGIDKIIPVDIYLPMCPPKPESLIDAIVKLQNNIKKETILERKNFMESHKTSLKEYCGLLVEEDFSVTKIGVE